MYSRSSQLNCQLNLPETADYIRELYDCFNKNPTNNGLQMRAIQCHVIWPATADCIRQTFPKTFHTYFDSVASASKTSAPRQSALVLQRKLLRFIRVSYLNLNGTKFIKTYRLTGEDSS